MATAATMMPLRTRTETGIETGRDFFNWKLSDPVDVMHWIFLKKKEEKTEFVTKQQTQRFPLTLHRQLGRAGLFLPTPVGGGTGQTFLAIPSISQEGDGGGCFPGALWRHGVCGLLRKVGDTPGELRRVR